MNTRMRDIYPLVSRRGSVSHCPLPGGLGWDANYPVSPSYRILDGGIRKGAADYTPFSGSQGTSYYQCRNGKLIWYGPTGNDTTGNGTLGNPYKTPSKAVQVANANGTPATIYTLAGEYDRSTYGALNVTLPTVPICFLASGGVVQTGAYDKSYTWTADATYSWLYSTGRSAVYAVYNIAKRDRFGNYVQLTKCASLAACSRIPGSWYTDGTTVWVHFDDESAVTNSTVRLYVTTPMCTFSFGAAPKDLFFDRETSNDAWLLEGGNFFAQASAYDTVDHIVAVRGMTCKYGPNGGATSFNNFATDNWRGLQWFEECYSANASADSFGFHNTLNSQQSLGVLLNCKARNAGVFGTGSNNHSTCHENFKGISIACDWEYAQGGTLRNINTTKWLDHGSKIRLDRGDLAVGGTLQPTECQVDNTAELWLNETIVEAGPNGYAFNATTGAIHLRNMADWIGRTNGTVDTWED